MTERMTKFRYFTLFDYDIEEKWLTEMHASGWKLVSARLTLYTFERCEPENVVYKLDFREAKDGDRESYLAMFREYGWEFMYEINNYCCFRRSVRDTDEKELDIFSDRQSRIDMMKRIIRWRLLPVLLIFLGGFLSNIPNCLQAPHISSIASHILVVVWGIIALLYLFIFIRCYIGYRRNMNRIEDPAES